VWRAFSDADIERLLQRVDTAAEQRDASMIADILSDAAVMQVEMPTPQGVVEIELNKPQYLEMLQQSWSAVGSTYKYSRSSTQIESNGTVAQIVSIVREEFEMGGQTIRSETLEVSDVAVENGEPVIVKVVGRMHVDGQPVPEPSI
jgi:hypothetical protein